jgi:hypothetical protein
MIEVVVKFAGDGGHEGDGIRFASDDRADALVEFGAGVGNAGVHGKL